MSKTPTNNSKPVTEVLWSVIFITFSVFLLNLIISISGAGEYIFDSPYQGAYILLLFLIQELILLAPVIYLIKKNKLKIELEKIKPLKLAGYVLGGFFFFIILNGIIQYLSLKYNIQIPGYGEQEMRLPLFGEGTISQIIAVFVLVILAPVTEELLFRGMVFNKLKLRYKPWVAVVLSAIIFAGFHLELQVFIPLFILGLIITTIYEKSGSLWVPIAFHIFNNLLAYLEEAHEITKLVS